MTRTKSTYLALVAVLLSPITVFADPITYVFDYPVWEFNGDPSVFGTSPFVSVSVDNGNTSFFDQIWDLSTDILEFSVTTIGGTYSNTWLGSEILFLHGLNHNYLTSNAIGLATLDLQTLRNSRVVFSNFGGTWQFGTHFSYTQSWLNTGPGFTGNYAYHSTRRGFTVDQRRPTAVPEPGTLALIGIGLFGMGLARRNKKV